MPERLEKAIIAIVGVGICTLPAIVVWDYGGVLPWTKFWASNVLFALGLGTLPLLFWHRERVTLFFISIPLLSLFIWGLTYAQTIPISSHWISWLSSGSKDAYQNWIPTALWNEYQSPSNNLRTTTSPSHFPISICPWLTKQAMSLPALFGLTTLLASLVYQTRHSVLMLLILTAMSGGAVSCMGIFDAVRKSQSTEMSTVVTPSVQNAAPFGPFVNKNNAACYLNLSLACTLGLLAFVAFERSHPQSSYSRYTNDSVHWRERLRTSLESYVLLFDAKTVFLTLLTGLQLAGVLVCSSRGGMLATVAGMLYCTVSIRRTKYAKEAGVVILIVVIATAFGLESLNLRTKAQDRAASIWKSFEQADDGRLQHWPDGLRAAWAHFPAGAGLGTYRYAYLPTQQNESAASFVNADAMPVEWLVEGGIWLIPLVLIGLVAVHRQLAQLTVKRSPLQKSVAVTGWYMLGALLVSQMFDFGILIPANYLTVAVLIGAMFAMSADRCKPQQSCSGRSSWERNPQGKPTNRASSISAPSSALWSVIHGAVHRLSLVSLVLVYLALAFVTIVWSRQAAVSDFAIRSQSIQSTQSSQDHESNRVDLPMSCDPFLQVAFARSILREQSRLPVVLARDTSPSENLEYLGSLASIEMRRAEYYHSQSANSRALPPDTVLLSGQNLQEIMRSRQLALAALVNCPLDFNARLILLLTSFVGKKDVPTTMQLLNRSAQLSPNTADRVLALACLGYAFPGFDASSALIARSLRLQPRLFDKLWPLILMVGDHQRMSQAFPDEPAVMLMAIESKQLPPPLSALLAERITLLLNSDDCALTDAEIAFLKGNLAFQQGDLTTANTELRTAVRLAPSQISYRISYVETLESQGKLDIAIQQILRCLVQSPENESLARKHRQLVRDWMDGNAKAD
ncbi:O-Antigen ligase [Rosistilla carotiformis]|uniref:O-Antigen ligase n=2 Tax=Rosistilla carotiformis TaxID=2528017 RepID=A0A518JLF0_9BACT|nr:O-Antigen ligase [Rosistilla carotiformis]